MTMNRFRYLRRRIGIITCCLATIGMLPTSEAVVAEDGFKPMFTDSSLTGWVRTNTPEKTWRFEDGVLYCTGKPIGEIRTERMYQNFVMELEWRHLVPKGNAGIFVWADDITSRGVPFHRGIEVQVLENAYGNNRSHINSANPAPAWSGVILGGGVQSLEHSGDRTRHCKDAK